ncbi:DUF6574 domain-containing protein [Kurthia massiliensis]|uniref:DUF6574 domain-containing protein n=1 Tax=Kurthia massiliensis TaxID=1033739 RepID=UPI00028992BB|nr:zinc ribbon domain-containing protein [Kurthia massiliensis]
MICTQCGHEQVSGNFCGKCGTPVQAQRRNVASPEPRRTQNATVEQLKLHGGNYFEYFMQMLKQPSKRSDPRHFGFAVATSIISVLLLTIVLFMFANQIALIMFSFYNDLADWFGESAATETVGLTFMEFLKMSIGIALFYAISIGIVLLLAQKLGTLPSFHEGILRIGAYNNIMNVVLIAALIFMLLKAVKVSLVLYGVSFFFITFAIPIYVAAKYYEGSKKIDPYIGYAITIVSLLIFYGILSMVTSNILEDELNFMDFLNF